MTLARPLPLEVGIEAVEGLVQLQGVAWLTAKTMDLAGTVPRHP